MYRQIADAIRARILDGTYGPGARLPSEAELMADHGVARATARQAIGLLVSEGLAESMQGRGVFVRVQPPTVRLASDRFARKYREAGLGAFAAEATRLGRTPAQELREVGVVDTPPFVAERLRLRRGAKVVVRRRRMLADGVPMQLADSYFPASWARRTALARPDTGPGGSYARIEDTGRRLSHAREELAARMPTREEMRDLALGPGVPVVRLVRTAYAVGGDPVEVFDSVLAADRHRFVYDLSFD